MSELVARRNGWGLPEQTASQFPGFVQPSLPLVGSARHNDTKDPAANKRYAAQIEDASLPQCLQRIAENRSLPCLGGVGRIEYQRCSGAEQADGNALATIAFFETISDAGTENAIDPSLQNRWRLPPPIGMDNHNPFRTAQLLTVLLDLRRHNGRFRNFFLPQERVEPFGIKIMEHHLVAIRTKNLADGVGQSVVETCRVGMTNDDEDLHLLRPTARFAQTLCTESCTGDFCRSFHESNLMKPDERISIKDDRRLSWRGAASSSRAHRAQLQRAGVGRHPVAAGRPLLRGIRREAVAIPRYSSGQAPRDPPISVPPTSAIRRSLSSPFCNIPALCSSHPHTSVTAL